MGWEVKANLARENKAVKPGGEETFSAQAASAGHEKGWPVEGQLERAHWLQLQLLPHATHRVKEINSEEQVQRAKVLQSLAMKPSQENQDA